MAQSISKVVFGGRLQIRDGQIKQARIALGSVAATPVRLPTVEAALEHGLGIESADRVSNDITPLDDVRSTANYRNAVAKRVIRSWLESCLERT